jgi:hypothetical protein
MSIDPSLFAQKSVFSFKRGQKNAQNKLQQRNKEQEIQEFADQDFNLQGYVSDFYTKQTPDKAPQHIDHLQHLLNNTNDLLKAYVYSNYTAFVHASNRTLSVENDIVFLNSLINNLKLSINTLPNETISIQSPNDQQSQKPLSLFGLETPQDAFVLSPNGQSEDSKSNSNNGSTLTGISGLYNRDNLMRIQMFKTQQEYNQNAYSNESIDGLLDLPNIKDKYAKYIQNTTTAKWKDDSGAVIGSMNNITIPTNETINLVELSEDLQSLIFERRLAEAVNLVELFVILGVVPPILQFDQSIMDSISNERMRNKDKGIDDLSSLSIFSTTSKRTNNAKNEQDDINPKLHYTSLDYVDNALINVSTTNPSHLRNRMVMSKAVLHENTANLTNPPLYFRPQTTTTAVQITNNVINKNFYQRRLEDVNRALLSSNDSNELTRARVYDNSVDLSKYNDGQYTFQPILNLPVFPSSPNAKSSLSPGTRPLSPKQATLDHDALIQLTPTPTQFSSLYGFGKKPPPSTWRLQHQVNSLSAQQLTTKKQKKYQNSQSNEGLQNQNIITIKQNKVEKNTNITHHYTKQSKVSTYIGKLVTVLVSLLLDELGECVGTQWEQDQRMLLLCRLNQHHLALHRYLVLQSQITQEALKKTRYKGDLRIITQSICQIVYSNIQTTIREFKRIFCSSHNNAPPTTSNTSTSSTTSSSSSGTTTTTTTAVVTTMMPNNTYFYFRDDLVAHLSAWIVLEITHLGKLIDSQLLHQDDKFSNFPNCINAVHEVALETDYTLGTTTSNILVQCIHPSIVRTINEIEQSIEKEINELLSREDWSPQALNFTLVPISIQTPKDLLAQEAIEIIEANQKVTEYRQQMEEYNLTMSQNRKKLKKLNKDNAKQDSVGDDDSGKPGGLDSDLALLGLKPTVSKADGTKSTTTSAFSPSSLSLVEPKKPELPPGIEDVIHDKVRLHVSSFSIQIYKTLLSFSRQLLSVVLCPIWHFSQESIVTVSVDVLCNCIEKVTRSIVTLIRKHLQTLVAPLPPDFIEFVTAPLTINKYKQNSDQVAQIAMDLAKKQEVVQKEQNLSSFLPNKAATDQTKSSLVYRATQLPSQEQKEQTTQQIQNLAQNLAQTKTAASLSSTTSKKEFKPLSETQLAILLNSLSFIAHYAFPYLSLFMSVNLCKPIPELSNACYKQRKLTISAFEHVSKKKALFLLRGRWFTQQELQYREKLEQQKAFIEKLIKENNRKELLKHQDSIIPLPVYKEDQDNINTLHLPFNGSLFWCDSQDLHTRYLNLTEFPSVPSIKSVSPHMMSLLCHIYQQWHSYANVLTPHQAKYMLRLLIAEILDGLLDVRGWEVVFPTKNMALYMICDFKVLMYFSFGLFGVFSESKDKLAGLIRRITRIYSKEYISSYEKEFKLAKIQQKKIEKEQALVNSPLNKEESTTKSVSSSSTSSTSSSSSSSSTTETTSDGKKVTKTTTTTTTSGTTSDGILNADLVDKTSTNSTSLTTSSLLLNATKTQPVTMSDLNNPTFIEARNNEVELLPQYYKKVAQSLIEYCNQTYTHSKSFNCQEAPTAPNQPK